MSCSSPLLGYRMKKVNFYTGEIENVRYRHKDEGLRFQGDIYRVDNRYHFLRSKDFPTKAAKYDYFNRLKASSGFETSEIPCGRCLECRLEYSRQWANRCMLEAGSCQDSWFLTLTYDEDHLPLNDFYMPTLRHDELSNFMKDLRGFYQYHYNLKDIRFFGCGEYGGKYGRPHYHVIVFNLPVLDLEFAFQKGDYFHFHSPSLSKVWDKGLLDVATVNWDTCAYVARYVIKKAKGENEFAYKDLVIEPEYVRMSRRPGIARSYFDSHKDLIYKFDKLTIPGVGPVRPGHYYDKLFDIEDPCRLDQIKELRKNVAITRIDLIQEQTDLSPLQYAENQHDLLVKKIESLKRDEF